LFLGRTRAGKSTVFEVLKDATYIPKAKSIFSETEDARLFSFTVELSDSQSGTQTNFNINIIDTPGLFEQKREGEHIRENEALKKSILKCMEYEITKIHQIFFVCSFSEGIHPQDISAFREFIELFSGVEEKVAMIITRSEGLDQQDKDQTIEELTSHKELKEISKLIGNKIFFSGATRKEFLNKGSVKALKQDLYHVSSMRVTLYNCIFNASEPFHLTNLDYYKQEQLHAQELQKEVSAYQEKLQDFQGTKQECGDLRNELKKKLKQYESLKGYIDAQMGPDFAAVVTKAHKTIDETKDKVK